MNNWLVGFIILLQVYSAKQQCLICSTKCVPLEIKRVTYTNISIVCNPNTTNIVTFFEVNDFKELSSFAIRYSFVANLDLKKLSNVKQFDVSQNNLTAIELSGLHNVQNVNISHNRLKEFLGNLWNLKSIDLSNNALSNVSQIKFNSSNINNVNLTNNHIRTLNNFSVLTLEHLNVANNKIMSLSLGYLPNLKNLDLTNNSIEIIHSNISVLMPKLEILILSLNKIKQLNDSNFNLSNLLKLSLNNNKIKYLSPKCFNGLTRLQYLDISKNEIITVFPSTLQYLSGLIQLIISENEHLFSQDFGLLLASQRLKSVNASKTNQKEIPSSLIRSVRYLTLSFNKITEIQSGDLDSYPLLNSLDLAFNKINFIEDDAFGRLELLIAINLNNNLLGSIPYTLPSNLEILLLSNNLITKITNSDFAGITRLKQLDLSSNKIISVSEDSFSQLYGLQKLNLSGNGIQVLSSSTFTGLQKLKVLDLSFLNNITKCKQALCFPVPESNAIQELYLDHSAILVHRLMSDAAALKTFKQLNILNIGFSNLTTIRNDMANYFPRLHYLYVQGNDLNCSIINTLYYWLEVKEMSQCIFAINDAKTTVTTNKITTDETTSYAYITTKLITENTLSSITNILNESSKTEYKNTTDLPMHHFEVLSNEIWYKESNLGEVDAFAADTPTSHPGLFILLLLPVALVSTCLIINYSRLRRKLHHEQQCEIDIEISNISSELW